MNEETKNGATAKTVCVCALLVAAGIAGGFAAGRMTGGASNEKVQSVETAKAHPDDAKKLAKAQKRIEELERDLAAAKARASRVKALALKAENSVSNLLAKSASDVSVVTTNADIEAELKRQLPEGAYHEATNAMSRLRAKLAERAKGRYDYIAAVDTSRMSKSERDNHKKFLELLEKRAAIRAKATGIIPNPSVLQEMVQLDMSMQKVAKQERSALVREVVRELGYSGDDVDVVHDTLVNVFDSTSGGGLNSLFEAASDIMPDDGGADGEPKVKVGVETQVIEL